MDDSAYMSSKTDLMHENLSGGSPLSEGRHSSATPSTSTYGTHDMTRSYTSVAPYSPYSVPAYDTSLPTPVSVAGSPSMPERSSKMLSTYCQHGGNSQQLTPPTTSRPWSYAHDMASNSSASMAVPSSTAEMLNIHSLESSHSPEQQAAVTQTPHFHWSTYGVSSQDATEELSPSQPLYSSVAPSVLMRSPHYGMSSTTHVPLAPALPHVSMPPHTTDARALMPSDLNHQFDGLSNISLEYGQAYPSRKSSKARKNRPGRSSKRGRNMYQNSTKNNSNGYGNVQADAIAAGTTPDSQDPSTSTPPKYLTLNSEAPADSRYLVEVRCQMSDDKGKGMWEHIQQAYKERFTSKTKENLQMQLIRSIQQYAIWPEEEDQALKAAAEEWERRRYPEIRKIMKEKGGRRVWDWNDGSIAKRLVEMGVDELDRRDPVKKVRRKRKSTAQSKSGGEAWTACVNIQYNNDPRELTAEENDLLLEAFCKTEPESPTHDHMEDITEPPSTSRASAARDSGESQSARVAKQACNQMLARQGEQLYNGHNRYMS
ncbi:hypothetical protein HD806DRAFT_525346 [Xylariaceae sp. AK1471]|nr:hypothetical protein HD806DRAFT_525346 [Xylariaceae sp. AK1471]